MPTREINPYDGTTAVETHLAKLAMCATYYCGNLKDIHCHLNACLIGCAREITGNTEEKRKHWLNCWNTDSGLISLHNVSEQNSTVWAKSAFIQSIYNVISRLFALHFHGQTEEICEILARHSLWTPLPCRSMRWVNLVKWGWCVFHSVPGGGVVASLSQRDTSFTLNVRQEGPVVIIYLIFTARRYA